MPDPTTTPATPVPFTVAAIAPKNGIATTEFWANIILTFIGAAVATNVVPAGGEASRIAAFAMMAISNSLYFLSRASVKNTATRALGSLPNSLPDMPDASGAGQVLGAAAVKLAPMLALFVLGAALVTGCAAKQTGTTPSTRDSLVATVVAGATAVATGFAAFDLQHQHDIVTSSASVEDGKAKLEAWRTKRDAVIADLDDLDKLVKTAKAAKDDASIASVVAAVTSLQTLIANIEGSK